MKTTRKKFVPMQVLRRAVRNRRERGMALLFTLCILSMALITAMIFSSNATTDRKVATAYIDTSSARILADGTVSRAVLALLKSKSSYACSNYLNDAPSNGTSGNKPDEFASDWIWKIEKPGVFSFNEGPLRYDNKYYDRNDTRCPSWEYVYYRSPDGTDRIYGRYAYVAIGQNDQLNPNAIGRRSASTQAGYDDNIRKKRLGRWTCEPEFNFKEKNDLWHYTDVTAEKIATARLANTSDWNDMDIFLADVAPSASDKHLRMMVDQYFDVSGEQEYNKYNTKGDIIKDYTSVPSGNESYRFPLIRNDWENMTVAQLKNAIPWFRDSKASELNQTLANLLNYNSSASRAPVTDVPNWVTGSPSYTGNKCTPYINEVAGEVEVGGNLGMRQSERYLDGNNDWKWRLWYIDCTYYHKITLHIETVNMYGSDAKSTNIAPIPFGTVSYDYYDPLSDKSVRQEFTFNANNTRWDVNGTRVTTIGNNVYTVYEYVLDNGSVGSVTTPKRDGYSRPVGNDRDFYQYLKVKNVRIRLDRLLLRDGSMNVDLAFMPSPLNSGTSLISDNWQEVAGVDGKRGYFDAQVNDPRCNLEATEWSVMPASADTWYGASSNIGRRNDAIKYDANKPDQFDPGESGDPGDNISTAFIRHAPMESLWELGAIHRGKAWQTINLKCAADKKNGTAMEDYAKGDGHLLDQIALVPLGDEQKTVLGMINLNCVADLGGGGSPFVFKSLFTNFPIYGSYAEMINGPTPTTRWIEGDAVNSTNSDADRYAQDLADSVTYAVANGNQPRRTAIFPVSGGTGSRTGRLIPASGNDAQREEVICRIINILKWSRQKTRRATVLVLAQTIQDVGGANLERYLPNDDSVLMDSGFKPYDAYGKSKWIEPALFKNVASIRSAYQNRTVAYKQYDNFYDRITGEAKVIVRLEWDDSAYGGKGAWKVTRKEYAE